MYLDDIAKQVRDKTPSDAVPNSPALDELFRLYAGLVLTTGILTTQKDVHTAWVVWKARQEPEHESLVPFEELDEETANQDQPFVEAIRSVAADLSHLALTPEVTANLFPGGPPRTLNDQAAFLELYKLMVASSEALVDRRQRLNTYFLTVNGALLTAFGLVLGRQDGEGIGIYAIMAISVAGILLSSAWISLINSFGQLNRGKFAVINSMEVFLPAAIYLAEWKALGEGEAPGRYRTFTSREIWVPQVVRGLHIFLLVGAVVFMLFGVLGAD